MKEFIQKEMPLSDFRKVYGMKLGKSYEMVHSKNSPAHKNGHLWFVDLEKYEEWKKQKHKESYKWSE